MPRTSERGGPLTRRKISDVATMLFLERGFDTVTVADVARQAGVSSVTVFKHFPRKEDLLFDRVEDAVAILRAAVRDRGAGVDALTSLRDASFRLVDERHALSGVKAGSIPFYRTVAASPALIARAREIAAELEQTLAADLEVDAEFDGDPTLFAALFIAGYTTVLTGTARRVIAADAPDPVVEDHRARLTALFDALRGGL
ncbi:MULTISPECIES: TetR/AcrR family transcriptional regulator [Mycobacteriaceae]|nr:MULTISPECIES: TetR/AcrR family transcriptional regulator [Mycobacteriaceae]AHC23892.2 TetR family transcriptional regulator [Mycolicibacterium neoaurum VKM Ac-1815D]AMO08054.1 TetR family transcriptional regulator [Mycolicibacterium neoaurum]AXK78620.1 TetR/AcrR family transcriptional regulator [Mycolicibacterium neoaurum]KJQ48612.1 TetR family transcriptional regulator [Mycolicibacterium neoaurum]KUM07001.1 TetR family transcriptional regulator [Mycolicibacterium neoaurum]